MMAEALLDGGNGVRATAVQCGNSYIEFALMPHEATIGCLNCLLPGCLVFVFVHRSKLSCVKDSYGYYDNCGDGGSFLGEGIASQAAKCSWEFKKMSNPWTIYEAGK